jgi:hypothetical protein
MIEANLMKAQPHRKLDTLYPDTGPFRRELYPKHQAFFCAGCEHEPIAVRSRPVAPTDHTAQFSHAPLFTSEYDPHAR